MNVLLTRRASTYSEPGRAKAAGLYPYYREIEGYAGNEVVIRGRRLLMFGSNDYLGLSRHPAVIDAARAAIVRYGSGPSGSRLLNGSSALHGELEARLAAFVGKPAALVFASGYQANVGALSALLGRNDVVLHDADNHASLLDGARLGFGKSSKFAHNDAGDLARALAACERSHADAARWVVVESVYSMAGDVAPLDALARVCRHDDVVLMIDEAHGIGVLGPGGRGGASAFGVTDDAALIMGTFSKTLASVGGFIAGEAQVIEVLRHQARALVFSAALAPASAAAALAALGVLESDPGLVLRLGENVSFARATLAQAGFAVPSSPVPIIPVEMGDSERAFTVATRLFEAGVFVNPIIPPAVPKGSAMLRFTVTAAHSRAEIARAVECLSAASSAPRARAPA